MSYQITPENEQYIQHVLERGDYEDTSAVVNEALRILQERECRVARLREQIQEGINSGPGIPGDVVFAELEEWARQLADPGRAK